MVQSEVASGLCKWQLVSLRVSSIMGRDEGLPKGAVAAAQGPVGKAVEDLPSANSLKSQSAHHPLIPILG